MAEVIDRMRVHGSIAYICVEKLRYPLDVRFTPKSGQNGRSKGYLAGAGGYEYVLLIGAVCFVIAIRGGGIYSVDRLIGKEL